MKLTARYIYISAVSFFGIFIGVAIASAACTLTLTPSSGGPGNVSVTATYNVSQTNFNGTETYVDIDWGDGTPPFSRVCPGGSCGGPATTTHVYNSTSTATIFCSNDDGPPLPGTTWNNQVSRNFTYNGGIQTPGNECSNAGEIGGGDDDGDGDVDMRDCGCTSPDDNSEADASCGGQPNWIQIVININATNPNTIGWKLICPPGSYTCVNPRGSQNGTVAYGTGPEQSAPYPDTLWDACKNGKCAGQGTYKLVPGTNAAGCVGQSKTIYYGTHLVSLTLDCLGGGGGGNPTVDLTCRDPNTSPGSQIQGPCKVPFNDNDWLAWTSSNATTCNAYVDGPVAYWPMDETSGSVVNDISGSGYGATAGANVSADPNGRFGYARNFAGTTAGNGALTTQGRFLPMLGVNQVSITGWINQPTFLSGNRHIFGVVGGVAGQTNDTFEITTLNGQGQVRIYKDKDLTNLTDYGMATTTGTPMQPGQWHHFAVVWDGTLSALASRAQVYIDGQRRNLNFVAVGNNGWLGTNLLNSAWRASFGAPLGGPKTLDEPATAPNPFQGMMDDFRVYDRPLSKAEIQAEAGVGPNPNPFPGQGPGWPGSNPILTSQADPAGYPVGPITATHSFGITCVGAGGSSSDVAVVGVGAGVANNPPSALNVTLTEPASYCSSGTGGTVSWTFSDPDAGQVQSQYQVQIDENGQNFAIPLINYSGVGPANSYPISPGVLQFNTAYQARVRVWDNASPPSPSVAWSVMSLCVGPGCDPTPPATYWNTPANQYPQASFTYSPLNPAQNQLISFTDTSSCYDSDGLCNAPWAWNFGDTFTSTSQNPTHAYTGAGPYTVNLSVRDANGYTCSTSQAISPSAPVPYWKEVLPQ